MIKNQSVAKQKSISLRQLPYRDAIIYGPIQSRRIGWSLGINLCPATRKICSYDCVYCQFPKANNNWRDEVRNLRRAPELLQAIEQRIHEQIKHKIYFDSITVSGNGDPSVHPDLLTVALFLRDLIKRMNLRVDLSILTNAVPYKNPDFIEALSIFDRKIIKLDAGDNDTLQRVNRPKTTVCLDDMVDTLAQLDGVTIQTMIITGVVDNQVSILNKHYSELVERAKASEVQLYTVNKRPAYDGVLPVSKELLREIAIGLRQTTQIANVEVYHKGYPTGFPEVVPPSANY